MVLHVCVQHSVTDQAAMQLAAMNACLVAPVRPAPMATKLSAKLDAFLLTGKQVNEIRESEFSCLITTRAGVFNICE